MSQPVLIKLYGNLSPVLVNLANELIACAAGAMGETTPSEIIDYDGTLLRISFEGIYFPVEEVIALIEEYRKRPLAQEEIPCGKLDELDLENWMLKRYLIEKERIIIKKSPLNNVLDYSGH